MLVTLGDRFGQFYDAQQNAGMGGAAGFFAALNVAGDMIGVNGIIGGAVRQDLATGAPLSNAEGNAQIIVGTFSLATTFVGAGAAGAAGKAGSAAGKTGIKVQAKIVSLDKLPKNHGGRLGGRRVSAAQLEVVERYLNRNGVQVVRNADSFLNKANAQAGFMPDPRSPTVYLRARATEYELLHELIHARQHIRIGHDRYMALGRLAREEHVYRGIARSRRPNINERIDAHRVIREYREQCRLNGE